MTRESLDFRIEDGIGHLVLDNPPKNEMNAAFFDAFDRFMRTEFPGLRVQGLVVRGAGRHFSSGADTDELIRMARGNHALGDYLGANIRAFAALEQATFPVVAAISGCCLGAGLELALACRFRVACRGAVFALPEAGFGLMPGCGGTVRLALTAGRATAVEMALSGRTVSAEEARERGFIDAMAERKELIAAATGLIRASNRRVS